MTPVCGEFMKREGTKMKKWIVIFLAALLLTVSASAEMTVGGWNAAETTEITEDRQALFGRAMEGLLGVRYEPVAYLGCQPVNGTNHCFLCRATVVYPGAAPAYKLVYIYEDLQGNAEILHIADLDLAALSAPAQE